MAILEDDYDQEFHYDGRRCSHGQRRCARSRHLRGHLSKILRLACAWASWWHPTRCSRAWPASARSSTGRAIGSWSTRWPHLLEEGEIQRHVRRMRRGLRREREAICEGIDRWLSGGVDRKPLAPGHLAAYGIDADAWQARALAKGVHFQTGRSFTSMARLPPLRGSVCHVERARAHVAVRRLAQVV